MSDDSVDDFVIRLGFEAGRPVVTVVGDVDVLTASSLDGVLNALIDGGYREIVADLGGLTGMDARGLGVIAAAARRVNEAAGTLIVRSEPALTRRMLDITRLSNQVAFETSEANEPDRASKHETSHPVRAVETSTSTRARSPHTFRRSSTDLIDAALRVVTSLAGATVGNADGASITLERHGRLMTVAASNEAVLTMDRHQYETGEGPCLDAKQQGRHFYIESLAEETRWPKFVPLALGQGIHSILSSPLLTHDRTQGALNIYSATKQAFGADEHGLAALFAEQASEVLTIASDEYTNSGSEERFAAALASRQTIHQAQGAIMALHDVSADQAFASLFQQARSQGITVIAHATEVVALLGPGRQD